MIPLGSFLKFCVCFFFSFFFCLFLAALLCSPLNFFQGTDYPVQSDAEQHLCRQNSTVSAQRIMALTSQRECSPTEARSKPGGGKPTSFGSQLAQFSSLVSSWPLLYSTNSFFLFFSEQVQLKNSGGFQECKFKAQLDVSQLDLDAVFSSDCIISNVHFNITCFPFSFFLQRPHLLCNHTSCARL